LTNRSRNKRSIVRDPCVVHTARCGLTTCSARRMSGFYDVRDDSKMLPGTLDHLHSSLIAVTAATLQGSYI